VKVIAGLKVATILLALYGVVWISLEGHLGQTILLAGWSSLVMAGYLARDYGGGGRVAGRRRLLLTAVTGLGIGLSTNILTLVLMAVKTGLHAHGPEFSQAEIEWVLWQAPVWTAAGLLAGLGLGTLLRQ
jgi:hypothetical protein